MWAFVRHHAGRIVVCALALSAAGVGIAYATIPDAGGVFTACMLNKVGTIRLIDPSLPASNPMSHCTSLESKITFNQQGPQGLIGPQGPPGSPGSDGAPGADGKDGVSPTVSQLPAGDPVCAAGGAAITDSAGHTADVCNGADGKDGQPFSGTFTSPNGQFSVSVTDTGIKLQSSAASVSLDGTTVNVRGLSIGLRGDTSIGLNAGDQLALNGGAQLALNGPSIQLNGSGCSHAARQGDLVSGGSTVPDGGPVVAAAIVTGSQSVCIGP